MIAPRARRETRGPAVRCAQQVIGGLVIAILLPSCAGCGSSPKADPGPLTVAPPTLWKEASPSDTTAVTDPPTGISLHMIAPAQRGIEPIAGNGWAGTETCYTAAAGELAQQALVISMGSAMNPGSLAAAAVGMAHGLHGHITEESLTAISSHRALRVRIALARGGEDDVVIGTVVVSALGAVLLMTAAPLPMEAHAQQLHRQMENSMQQPVTHGAEHGE